MLWLKGVSDDEAEGYVREVFDRYRETRGAVPELSRGFGH